jgi:hypothetical protein
MRRVMARRSIPQSLVLVFATSAAGWVIRFAPLGLPAFVVKYGGSMLWALLISWIVSAFFPERRLVEAGLISGCVASGVEFFKLYRSPWMDAFRGTLPGVVLLGRHFSGWDILAYWVAIGCGVVLDGRMRGVGRARAKQDS